MMAEILHKAIAIECRKAVPDLRRIYRDNIPQDFQTPCILVTSVKTEVSRNLGDVQRIKEIFDVLYFPDGEIQNAWKQCETVKQGMLRCFDVIKADGISFYVRNKTASITDDVLHVLFDVTYREKLQKEVPKMEKLSTNLEMED